MKANLLKTDMAGAKVADILAKDDALVKAYGYKGTPTFRVGDETVTGARSYSDMRAIVQSHLKAP